MSQEKETINISHYSYTPDQTIEVNALMFMDMMKFFGEVKNQEYKEVLLARKVKSLKKGKVEWSETNPEEFFNQEPQPAYTYLGSKALDLEYMLQNIHYTNIEEGKATHKDELYAKFSKPADTATN